MRLTTLNRLRPNFDYLVSAMTEEKDIDRKRIEKYLFYFKSILDVVGPRADVYGLLGYCYGLLGENQKAIEFYQKAEALNPRFFWFHYNLATLYFRENRYKEALGEARLSLQQGTIDDNLNFIYKSYRVYLPIIAVSGDNLQQTITGQLKRGYFNIYLLMILSPYYMNDFPLMLQSVNDVLPKEIGSDAHFYFLAGVALYNLNDYERSIVFLQNTLNKDDKSWEAYDYLAMNLEAMGKAELARGMKEQGQIMKNFDNRSYLNKNYIKLFHY